MTSEHERLARKAWRGLGAVLERHFKAAKGETIAMGLSPVMVQALFVLHSMPPGPMSQLATAMSVDPAWITAVVDRLEAHGEVVRVPSSADRRVKVIELTKSGRTMCRKLDRLRATPPPELRALSVEDLQVLVEIADKLAAASSGARTGAGPYRPEPGAGPRSPRRA